MYYVFWIGNFSLLLSTYYFLLNCFSTGQKYNFFESTLFVFYPTIFLPRRSFDREAEEGDRENCQGIEKPSNLIPVRQTFFLIEKIVAERNCKGIEINKNSNFLYRIGPVDKADAIRPRADSCSLLVSFLN